MPTPAARPGPPWAMAEMIAAEPASRGSRRGSPGRRRIRRPRLAARRPRAARGRRAGGRHRLRHVRARARWRAAAILREALARSRAAPVAGRSPARRSSSSLDPPAGGLVHRASATRAATTRDHRRDGGGPGRGRADGADHRQRGVARGGRLPTSSSRRSRWTAAGATRSATCRRSSPRRSAASCWPAVRPAGSRSGRRLAAGIEAAHAAGAGGSRPDESIAAHDRRRDAPARRRHRRRPDRRTRARPQGRGGVAGSRRRSRDLETFLHGHLPATGAETALVAGPRPSAPASRRGPKRARQALAAAAAPRDPAGGDPGRRRRRARSPTSLTPAGRIVVPEAPDLPAAVASLLATAGPLQLVTLEVAAAPRHEPRPDPPRRPALPPRRPTAAPERPEPPARSPAAQRRTQPNSDSAARSIISRSRGRKSWSMIRSTPGRLERARATRAPRRACRGSSGRARGANHASPAPPAPNAASSAARAAWTSSSRPADQHPDHRRVGDRRRVAAGRPAALVERRVLRSATCGARRRQVELVRVAGGDPERARRPLAADDDRRPAAVAGRERRRLRPEQRVLDRVVLADERPAVGLLPQAVEDLERLLEHVGPLADLREREAVPPVLGLVPAGADADLDPPAAHLVDGDRDLGEVARASGT